MVTVGLHEALQPPPSSVRRALARRSMEAVTIEGTAAHVVQRVAVSAHVRGVVVAGTADADTLRAIADATAQRPELAVVMIGTAADAAILVALASGVGGYLQEPTTAAEVADALAAVLGGAIVAPPGVTAPLVGNLRTGSRRITVHDPTGRPVALTGREWEVLVLLRQGRSTAEIARRLVVAPVTVRSHVAALVDKFRVARRDDLIGEPQPRQ